VGVGSVRMGPSAASNKDVAHRGSQILLLNECRLTGKLKHNAECQVMAYSVEKLEGPGRWEEG
jgi:hypothetical protein